MRLQRILAKALEATAVHWKPVKRAYRWVHQAAHIRANAAGLDGAGVRRRLRGLLAAMTRWRQHTGPLMAAIGHFLKVSKSYWEGLFHCYDVPGLPRTNNDLEHCFGSYRYHERRTTGRKVGSPPLVLRGSVHILAAVATRQRIFTAEELAEGDLAAWRLLRTNLQEHQHQRVLQRRFRRDPQGYLDNLQSQLIKLILPS